jgi:hypothetical protein
MIFGKIADAPPTSQEKIFLNIFLKNFLGKTVAG